LTVWVASSLNVSHSVLMTQIVVFFSLSLTFNIFSFPLLFPSPKCLCFPEFASPLWLLCVILPTRVFIAWLHLCQ
jgi:hypothetical protein